MALTAERSCLWKTHEWCEMRSRKTIFLLHLWNVLILRVLDPQTASTHSPCQGWVSKPFHFKHPITLSISLTGRFMGRIFTSEVQCSLFCHLTNVRAGKGCSSDSPQHVPHSVNWQLHYLCDATGINSNGSVSERHQVIHTVSLTGTAVAPWSHFFFLRLLPLLEKWSQ